MFGAALFDLAIAAGPSTAGRGPRTAVVAAVSGLVAIAGTIAFATGGIASLVDPGLMRVFFLETPFGAPLGIQVVLDALLVVVAFVPCPAKARAVACLAVATALLVGQAWLGHAVEGGDTPRGWAMIASYAIHVLAGAAWVGALPSLASVVARRGGDAAITAVLDRYALLGFVAVSLIVASGIANTTFHVDDLAAAARSGYGRILATKVALVAAMLLLAALNRFTLTPRLRAGVGDGTVRALRASIGAELALAVLVLAAASLLGITPPPR